MRKFVIPDMKCAARAVLCLGLFMSSCSEKPPQAQPQYATPSEVYGWADVNINLIPDRFLNESVDTLLADAFIPSDFPYGKTRVDFPDAADIEYEIHALNFKTIKNAGIISSLADFCKLDYKALNFFPLMTWQRDQLPEASRNGYEIYVLGVAHGYAMGKTDQWLETYPIDCAQFEAALAGRFFSEVFDAAPKTATETAEKSGP